MARGGGSKSRRGAMTLLNFEEFVFQHYIIFTNLNTHVLIFAPFNFNNTTNTIFAPFNLKSSTKISPLIPGTAPADGGIEKNY